MAWQPLHARGTAFHNLVDCVQSALASVQGSEHYLVAFYDKLSSSAAPFFWHLDTWIGLYCFWDNDIQSDPCMYTEADLNTKIEFQNIVQYCVEMSCVHKEL